MTGPTAPMGLPRWVCPRWGGEAVHRQAQACWFWRNFPGLGKVDAVKLGWSRGGRETRLSGSWRVGEAKGTEQGQRWQARAVGVLLGDVGVRLQ